jgi:DNA-directed RNA polymerase sigma subunit (sigma70/sigma32)
LSVSAFSHTAKTLLGHDGATDRFSEPPSILEKLGRELSISSERVRQIESRAFTRVRRAALDHLKA